ncbi:MAG: nucleoside deaminase [Bacilli bacterium]
MNLALKEACKNQKNKFLDGGPFGAVVVKDGKVIASAHNKVLKTHDVTSHAEINAIRKACKKLKTHDLSGCIIYTTSYPCPMCIGAIIWANIKTIYYGNSKEETNAIGFRDDIIYNVINNLDKNETINFIKVNDKEIKDIYTEFKNTKSNKMY